MATAEELIRIASQRLMQARKVQQQLQQLTPQAPTAAPADPMAAMAQGAGIASIASRAALQNVAQRSPFVANSASRVRKSAGMSDMPELPRG